MSSISAITKKIKSNAINTKRTKKEIIKVL
jgi:hypothetical protein